MFINDTLFDSNLYLLTIKKAYLGVVFWGATYPSQFMDKWQLLHGPRSKLKFHVRKCF